MFVKNERFWFLICSFFFVLCSEKPKANRRVMTVFSLLSRFRRGGGNAAHRLSTDLEHGMAAANTLLSGGEVISALLCADVLQTAVVSEALFPHVHTWKKQNIFT